MIGAGVAGEVLAVVAAAIVERGRLLVVSKRIAPEMFQLPGGKPEPGEDPEETLLRELDEELGCRPTITRPLGVLEDVAALEGGPMRLTVYTAELSGDQLPEPAAELAALRWLPLTGPEAEADSTLLAPAVRGQVIPLLTRSGAV